MYGSEGLSHTIIADTNGGLVVSAWSNKKKLLFSSAALFVGALVALYTQCTIFVVAPIGAVPEGKTLIIAKMPRLNFIDSADAMCERTQSGVSLLCRGVFMATIINNAEIYMRLPYSETLYLISTDGRRYDS